MLSHFATELGSLELTDILFNDFLDLASIVSSFKGLHSLTLSRVQWNENSFNAWDDVKPHGLPPSLSMLRTYNLDHHTFVGWLLSHHQQTPLKLSTWHFGPITLESKVVCAQLLLQIRHWLTELGLVFDSGDAHYGDAHYQVKGDTPEGSKGMQELVSRFKSLFGVDVGRVLQCAQELRVVRLYKFLSSNERERSAARLWIPKLLVSIESPKLEKVVLDVEVESLREAGQTQMNWGFLDEILNTDIYLAVHIVQFNVLTKISLVSFEEWIALVLPVTYSRGIVRVVGNPEGNKWKLF